MGRGAARGGVHKLGRGLRGDGDRQLAVVLSAQRAETRDADVAVRVAEARDLSPVHDQPEDPAGELTAGRRQRNAARGGLPATAHLEQRGLVELKQPKLVAQGLGAGEGTNILVFPRTLGFGLAAVELGRVHVLAAGVADHFPASGKRLAAQEMLRESVDTAGRHLGFGASEEVSAAASDDQCRLVECHHSSLIVVEYVPLF